MSLKNQSGQAQLLMALVAGIIVIFVGIFSMDLSRRSSENQGEESRISEIRSALDETIRFINNIYTNLSGCDPNLLNDKINYLTLDGSFTTTPAKRVLRVSLTSFSSLIGKSLEVSIGPIQYLSPTGADDLPLGGTYTSKDATVKVWVTDGNGIRVQEKAALINTCTTPCSLYQRRATSTSTYLSTFSRFCQNQPDQTVLQIDDSISYSWIVPSLYSQHEPMQKTCFGTAYFASDGFDQISVLELQKLREYLRSGVYGPLSSRGTDYSGLLATQGCMDLNGDRILNNSDLTILEKFLRGYLPYIPINP